MVSTEVAAIALMFSVHVAGAAVLIVCMFDGERPGRSGWWPTDAGDEGDGPPPAPPAPRLGPDGLPLPADAQPASTRLREPGRIGEQQRPSRRPGRRPHVRPGRAPQPAPPPRVGDRDAP